MFLHDAGAVNLVVAVIQQAVTDYRYAQKMARTDVNRRRDAIHQNCTRDPKAALDPWEQLNQLEMFFKGRWFHTLVDIDGERVVELLNSTREGKRVTRRHGVHDERLRAIPRQKGKPGRPIDWEKIAQWPDVKARLEAGNYSRQQVAQAMGLKDSSSVLKLMNFGTAKTKRRFMAALDRLEREEVGDRR